MARRESALEVMAMKFWQDRPVLVTGATGLLGDWLIRQLLRNEADVVCLVRDWVPQSEFVHAGSIDQVKVVRGDIRDGRTLERILGEYEVEVVFNLAAQTIVTIANRNPSSTFETNIGGTWKLLEASRRSPTVRAVIQASSDKAYGEKKALPYVEEDKLNGKHPYDVSKSCSDMLAQSYATTYSLPVSITRCGNFFGGGDLNWNRIIPGTIRSVLRGKQPIIRSDGQYVRDYLYVEDAAAANILLAERLVEDASLKGEAFNFSYERPMSVLQIVQLLLKLMQSDLKPEIQNQATGEIRNQHLSAEKAKNKLAWKPLVGLESGLGLTINWYRELLRDKS